MHVYLFAGYGKAYFIGSIVFHAFDIIVTMFATYHLRNASTMVSTTLSIYVKKNCTTDP